MTFGEILIKLRESNNLSRKDLAETLNIPYINLSKYETNERFPPQDMLFIIADYFDVSIDYLLGRSKVLRILPVPDLLFKISEKYSIDYVELMDLAGYVEKENIKTEVSDYVGVEKWINDLLDYNRNLQITKAITNLSEDSQEDLIKWLELLQLRDKEKDS